MKEKRPANGSLFSDAGAGDDFDADWGMAPDGIDAQRGSAGTEW